MKCKSCGADVKEGQYCEYCGSYCDITKDNSSLTNANEKHVNKLTVQGINEDVTRYSAIHVKGNLIVNGTNCDVRSKTKNKNGKILIVDTDLIVTGINCDLWGVKSVDGEIICNGVNCDVDDSIC